ncbi:MFS transporter [Cupriavidus sp. 30B13]|uniref:MFS transporter n=1 Tax=Cupriavidus sp. 30B13 TaxID=3384241 RepID=UPI003B8EC466
MSTTPLAQGPCDDGALRHAPPPADGPGCPRADEPWVLAATILASSMAFIDGTVVNVALPALQKDLGAGLSGMQWAVEAYALLLAALLLVGGAAGDRFGRRRVFALGVAVFAAASAWCGLAGNIGHLVAARAAQGVGAALLVPGSLALLSASFDESRRGKAIGTWSGATAMTTALGPVVGGWLIEHLSWRAAFLVNLPLAAAVLLIAFWRVPESRAPAQPGPLDWPGSLLAALGLGGVVYALIASPEQGWGRPAVWLPAAAGVLALALFARVEARAANPVMPPALFRSRAFLGANLLTLLLYAALGGGLFFFPLNLIQVQGYSPTGAGAALLPFILLMFLLSGWAGGLADRHGARRPLIVGPLVAAAGFALFALPGAGGSYWTTFFPAVAVLGAGMSISVAPLTTTVMNAVPPGTAGTASGINNAAARVATLLAIAGLGIVMAGVFGHRLERALARPGAVPPQLALAVQAQRGRLAAIAIPPAADAQAARHVRQAVDEAFVAGFRAVMLLSALLAAGGAGCAWWLLPAGRRAAPAMPPARP